MANWEGVADRIGRATRTSFRLARTLPLGGGCINRAYRLEGMDGACYFLKLNDARQLPMFEAECAGLTAIAATRAIRVPHPVACGISDGQSYLVLEHLELSSRGDAGLLGEQLAALHRCTSPRFGFAHDNFIGATPQPNGWKESWPEFWRERRMGFQLDLAARNGYGGKLQDLGRGLMEVLPAFFGGYTPQPSLLHGDLWDGNHAYTADNAPILFDPAPYYGDRETDLAMTELFGGFGPEFYAGRAQ